MEPTSNVPQAQRLHASFRDPSGFLFRQSGILYRQVNQHYQADYDLLMTSGLYQHLVDQQLLIPHEEVDNRLAVSEAAYKVLQPQPVPFISYPYEWSFNQLKAAALATLSIQRQALEKGMTLKDASAYNIQFLDGKPILIDTLSFERYHPGDTWTPYRQFCQHFLAPLALMGYTDIRLSQLMRVYIDGVPLDLAARLLPWNARLRLSLLLHIFLHANTQQRYSGTKLSEGTRQREMSSQSLLGLLDNLEQGIHKLRWKGSDTPWRDYYNQDSYTDAAFEQKKQLVTEFIAAAKPQTAWDLGANTGVFSRILSQRGIHTVAWDTDEGAVDANYQHLVANGERYLLPLVLDLTNPSPAIGWGNRERMGLSERGEVSLILALALVHHLAIGNNVPLPNIAAYFASLCQTLIIEFVPKEDPKVQTLLANRLDIFPTYTQQGFEEAFAPHFSIQRQVRIPDSLRTLYLMERNHAR